MLAERPNFVDQRSSAVPAEETTPLDDVCAGLDGLLRSAERSARGALNWFTAYCLLLLCIMGLPPLLLAAQLRSPRELWWIGLGLAAVVLPVQFFTLRSRLLGTSPRLPLQLELSDLGGRIDAGLLEEHARAREFYVNYPGRRSQLSSTPYNQLAYLLLHLELYLGSAPITPAAAPWILAVLIVFACLLGVGLLLPLLAGQPLTLFYLAFIPFSGARTRIDLLPRARALAEYLRREQQRLSALAGSGAISSSRETLAVLERQSLFALDVNQLDLDLQRMQPGFGQPPGKMHWWASGIVATLGITGLSLGHSAWCGLVGIALAGVIAYAGQSLRRSALAFKPRMRAWLEESAVLPQIALEELTDQLITERIPLAWRSLLRNQGAIRWPQYRSGLKRTLWAVAFNAGWLESGARLSRHPGFLTMGIFAPAMFLSIVAAVSAGGLSSAHGLADNPLDVLAFAVAAFSIVLIPALLPMQQQLQRRIIGAEEFVALLQRRLLE